MKLKKNRTYLRNLGLNEQIPPFNNAKAKGFSGRSRVVPSLYNLYSYGSQLRDSHRYKWGSLFKKTTRPKRRRALRKHTKPQRYLFLGLEQLSKSFSRVNWISRYKKAKSRPRKRKSRWQRKWRAGVPFKAYRSWLKKTRSFGAIGQVPSKGMGAFHQDTQPITSMFNTSLNDTRYRAFKYLLKNYPLSSSYSKPGDQFALIFLTPKIYLKKLLSYYIYETTLSYCYKIYKFLYEHIGIFYRLKVFTIAPLEKFDSKVKPMVYKISKPKPGPSLYYNAGNFLRTIAYALRTPLNRFRKYWNPIEELTTKVHLATKLKDTPGKLIVEKENYIVSVILAFFKFITTPIKIYKYGYTDYEKILYRGSDDYGLDPLKREEESIIKKPSKTKPITETTTKKKKPNTQAKNKRNK